MQVKELITNDNLSGKEIGNCTSIAEERAFQY